MRMRTADADGGQTKKIIIETNYMKNNKLIIEIVGQLMPFKQKLMKINAV